MSSYFFLLFFINFSRFSTSKEYSAIVFLAIFCKNLLPVRTSMETSEIENETGC